MIWWDAGRLAQELRAGRVSARDQLHYLLASLVLQTLSGRASLLAAVLPGGGGPRVAFWPLLTLAVAAAGFVACFRANARGDGRAFLERVVCLGLPVGLRVYAGYAALAGLFLLAAGPTGARRETFGPWLVWSLLYVGALAATFLTLRRYVALAAGAAPPPPPA